VDGLQLSSPEVTSNSDPGAWLDSGHAGESIVSGLAEGDRVLTGGEALNPQERGVLGFGLAIDLDDTVLRG
jgi:hypothetical protein